MKLSDVMSGMELSVYAQLGLLLFLLAFALITVDLLRSKKSELDHAQMLPFDDEREEGRLP